MAPFLVPNPNPHPNHVHTLVLTDSPGPGPGRFDPRYGAGSSPPNNALITLLHRCGYRQFRHHLAGGWPSDDEGFIKHGMDNMRYNIASFIKKR